MNRHFDLLITAIAPAIWGSTYLVTTELLPQGYPMTVAMLRALPAGLFLLLLMRELPKGIWIGRSLALGALNFSFFGPCCSSQHTGCREGSPRRSVRSSR